MLVSEQRKGYLMGASSVSKRDAGAAESRRLGIVPGHAYSLQGVYERGGLRLVKLRNPWGHKVRIRSIGNRSIGILAGCDC